MPRHVAPEAGQGFSKVSQRRSSGLDMRANHRRSYIVLPIALGLIGAARSLPAQAATWHVNLDGGSGIPSGYVQVRENQIEGTPLSLRGDLGVTRTERLSVGAVRSLGGRGQLHLWLGATRIRGRSVLSRTAYFNGTTLAPGPISSQTGFQDDWQLRASYWYRLYGFASRGGIWLSGGLDVVLLNFRIHARIAPGSVGHETKEDFNTQELPVPILGVHLRYPLVRDFDLFAGIEGGHIPWTNSLRREGGMVQVTQTDADAVLGVRYGSRRGWSARLYWYDTRYWQDERSAEDGNYARINRHGIGLAVGYRF